MADDDQVDIKAVFADPAFRQLSGIEKIKVMKRLDPNFAALPAGEQVSALYGGVNNTPLSKKPFWESFKGTLKEDVSALPGAVYKAATDLPGTAKGMWSAQREQFEKARKAYREGNWSGTLGERAGAASEVFGHSLAAALPVLGPAAAQIGEEAGEGDYGAAAAHALELAGPEATRLLPTKPLIGAARMSQVERAALEATERAGVPLSVGQKTGRTGLQKVERGLVNLPGSEERAGEFFLGQQEKLEGRGRELAKKSTSRYTQPPAVEPYAAGEDLQGRLKQRMNRLRGYSRQLYDSVETEAASNVETLKVGEEPIIGANGQPVIDPTTNKPLMRDIMEDFETPVAMGGLRRGLRPMYEDLQRAMPVARREASPAFTALEELMRSKAPYMNAMDLDRTLSAVKALAREEGENPYLTTQSQRVALGVIADGEKSLERAMNRYSGAMRQDLLRARRGWKGYVETGEMLADLPEEPGAVYSRLSAGRDTMLNTLKDLQRVAPREVQNIGRTYLEEMLKKATKEGGFHRSAGIMADWDRMGTETKRLMFGPKLTLDLDQFLLAAKKLAPAEGSATAGRIAAFAPYMIGMDVMRALVSGGPAAAAGEAALGIGAAYVAPNIAARMLLTPGGAKLLTSALKLAPAGGVAFREAMRGVTARVQLASKQEREDRQQKTAAAADADQGPASGGDLVPRLADAIQQQEGWVEGSVSQRNNNPGNIRPLPNQKLQGMIGRDKKGFAIFSSYADGRKALEDQVSYQINKGQNLYQFFAQYAPAGDEDNDPVGYAEEVHRQLGIDPRRPLSELLQAGGEGGGN